MNLIFDKELSIEVVRTKRRKTASIKVNDGVVQAIIPDRLSDARVEALIQKRTSWIRRKLREQLEVVTPKPKEYVNGESFTYLGRQYRLKVLQGADRGGKLKGGCLEVGLPRKSRDGGIRNALVEWYEKHALDRLTEKTNRYAGIMGVSPNSISVRDYKSRWGSCSSKKEISYNWRIIIAPQQIVDYVVVHELCHLKHLNHSRAYWNSVEREVPDYGVCRHWLKMHAGELVI